MLILNRSVSSNLVSLHQTVHVNLTFLIWNEHYGSSRFKKTTKKVEEWDLGMVFFSCCSRWAVNTQQNQHTKGVNRKHECPGDSSGILPDPPPKKKRYQTFYFHVVRSEWSGACVAISNACTVLIHSSSVTALTWSVVQNDKFVNILGDLIKRLLENSMGRWKQNNNNKNKINAGVGRILYSSPHTTLLGL